MYFNGISALAHKFYNDPLLPLADPERLDRYIGNLATSLGWALKNTSEAHYHFNTQEQEFVISVSRSLNRKLHCIYTWGQSRGERFDIFTHKGKRFARTRDIGYVLVLPNSTYNKISKAKGVSVMTIRESLGILQKYLDVTFISYHQEQHHLGWWTRTTFAKNPIIWNMLTEIYTGGEEVRKRAKDVITGVEIAGA